MRPKNDLKSNKFLGLCECVIGLTFFPLVRYLLLRFDAPDNPALTE